MKGLPFVLLFTAMTFFSWGTYGPVLHHGAVALDHDSMRAFVGVGLAYFLVAVLFPAVLLRVSGEVGKWTLVGAIFSMIAGSVGALGALGVILALGQGGKTVYVMPLVFGFAPVVNTLVTAALTRSFGQIRPIFIGGIIVAALGAGGVLVFKPSSAAPAMPLPAESSPAVSSSSGVPGDAWLEQLSPVVLSAQDERQPEDAGDTGSPADDAANSDVSAPEASPAPATGSPEQQQSSVADGSVLGIILSIIMAAVCWGSYGPMLHIGQGKMEGSRMRPFICVGMAYFFIAVAAPLIMIYSRSIDGGTWTSDGMMWSIFAGVAGALGALGVILAFNAGGKPYYVMPLVFGFAPVINTFIALTEAGTWGLVSFMFWLSLALVITGAVTVLITAPRPKKPAPAPAVAPSGS